MNETIEPKAATHLQVKVRVEAFCPRCGYLCTSEEHEVKRNTFDEARHHVNMLCWSCREPLPEITVVLEPGIILPIGEVGEAPSDW